MQTKRTDLWTQQGRERVEQTERAVLTYIHYHKWKQIISGKLLYKMRSPAQNAIMLGLKTKEILKYWKYF